MVERIAELDDALTVKYLEGEEISIDELKDSPPPGRDYQQSHAGFLWSSLRNKGVQLVLDAVIDYLPSPLDVLPMIGTDPRTDEDVELPPRR